MKSRTKKIQSRLVGNAPRDVCEESFDDIYATAMRYG